MKKRESKSDSKQESISKLDSSQETPIPKDKSKKNKKQAQKQSLQTETDNNDFSQNSASKDSESLCSKKSKISAKSDQKSVQNTVSSQNSSQKSTQKTVSQYSENLSNQEPKSQKSQNSKSKNLSENQNHSQSLKHKKIKKNQIRQGSKVFNQAGELLPKRPTRPYIMFFSAMCKQKRDKGDTAEMETDRQKIYSQKWKDQTEQERDIYNDKFKIEMKRYLGQLFELKKNGYFIMKNGKKSSSVTLQPEKQSKKDIKEQERMQKKGEKSRSLSKSQQSNSQNFQSQSLDKSQSKSVEKDKFKIEKIENEKFNYSIEKKALTPYGVFQSRHVEQLMKQHGITSEEAKRKAHSLWKLMYLKERKPYQEASCAEKLKIELEAKSQKSNILEKSIKLDPNQIEKQNHKSAFIDKTDTKDKELGVDEQKLFGVQREKIEYEQQEKRVKIEQKIDKKIDKQNGSKLGSKLQNKLENLSKKQPCCQCRQDLESVITSLYNQFVLHK